MSLFDENIIKKDLSVESILQQNVFDVVNAAYHDIQYRIDCGQTLFKLHPREYRVIAYETTSNFIVAFKDTISWGMDGLRERLCICPINWNDAKLNINYIDNSISISDEKINVNVLVNYKIFKPRRFIGEPHILDEDIVSYLYILDKFKIEDPSQAPMIRLYECI